MLPLTWLSSWSGYEAGLEPPSGRQSLLLCDVWPPRVRPAEVALKFFQLLFRPLNST